MMTRRAAAVASRQQENDKLKVTLLELKKSKEMVTELLCEREENEKELLSVLESRDKLKKQLCVLEQECSDVIVERDKLQVTVDSFTVCSAEYEQALKSIDSLEKALFDAHEQIHALQEEKENTAALQTQSLYSEVVGISPQLVTVATGSLDDVIDLTNDTLPTSRLLSCSNNKLGKINRYIRKTQKLIKHNKLCTKNLKVSKKNVNLLHDLNMCVLELESTKLMYETDTQNLHLKIQSLEDSLRSLNSAYLNSEKVINEYSLAMDDLIQEMNHNCERFESLTNNHTCRCEQKGGCLTAGNSPGLCDSLPTQGVTDNSSAKSDMTTTPDIIMYCDEIGSGMGSALHSYSKGHSVISNCSPFSTVDNIINQILNDSTITASATLIIFMGNRGDVNKNNLIKFYETLNGLSVKKIILFTFPYCNQLTQNENVYRHNMNITMYNLCTYNNKFDIIDTNNYVSNYFTMTKGTFYLSNYCKRQIAMSLLYLYDITAKNLASNSAFTEQPNMNLVSDQNNRMHLN